MNRLARVLVVSAVLTTFCLMAGCAARKHAFDFGDPESGLTLQYRVSEGDVLPYRFNSTFEQTMELMGQKMSTTSAQMLTFSMTSLGGAPDHRVAIELTGMELTVNTPQGDIEADPSTVVGRTFEMTLSPRGEESDLPDPSAVVYVAGPQGEQSVIPGFATMFPDLPDSPVVVGDSWPSSAVIEEDGETTNMTVSMDIINTFEGVEEVDGVSCARVRTSFVGLLEGGGEQQGMPWTIMADMEGTGYWLFDYASGTFLEEVSEGSATGTIETSTPGGDMEIPLVREFLMTTELIR